MCVYVRIGKLELIKGVFYFCAGILHTESGHWDMALYGIGEVMHTFPMRLVLAIQHIKHINTLKMASTNTLSLTLDNTILPYPKNGLAIKPKGAPRD